MSKLAYIMMKSNPYPTIINVICRWMIENKTSNFSMFDILTDEISIDDWMKVLRLLTRREYTKPIGQAVNKDTGKRATLYNGSNLRFEYDKWAHKNNVCAQPLYV